MATEEGLLEVDASKNSADAALRELKWKEFMTRMNAYRFYIKLMLGVNGFFYATTGAVVLYYVKDTQNVNGLFLLLPILMGTVIGGFMIYATALQKHNQDIIEQIREKFLRPVERVPDLDLLHKLLWVFGPIFLIVAAVLSFVPLVKSGYSRISVGIMAGGLVIVLGGFVCSMCYIRQYQKWKESNSKADSQSPQPEDAGSPVVQNQD